MDCVKTYLHANWEFAWAPNAEIQYPDNTDQISFMKAAVPGTNLLDLQHAGKVEANTSPDYESSFSDFRFKDFIYRTRFNSSDIPQKENMLLCFEGIDTVCEIYLNAQHLASTENCFREYRFDIKPHLQTGENELVLIFRSPMIESTRRQEEHLKRFPTHLDLDYMYLRKPAYSFFWDWGAAIPVSGIYRPVYITSYDDGQIENYFIRYNIDGTSVSGTIVVETPQIDGAELTVTIGDHSFTQSHSGTQSSIAFRIPDAELWFPNGYGEPHLYDMSITLGKNKLLDSKKQKIGFRKVRLLRDPREDGKGTRFRLEINDVPVFCRGYNWVPFDSDIPHGGNERYVKLLELAAVGNVNMLRIWGGGFYEENDFYRICDEKGIMVWQDAMFVCTLYPDDNPHFIKEVKAELVDNIKRLRNFTSLVMWCGENECHEAYYEWWNNRHDEFERFFGGDIYHKIFPALLKELDPDRPYWPGSPYSGNGKYLPNDVFNGDSHPWDLFKHTMDFTNFRLTVPSFVSEMGIQSFPELRTALSIGSEKDHAFQSFLFETRNHFESPAKNERLLKFISALFRITEDFQKSVILSHLAQAEYLKYALEHWRAHSPDCSGALLWQYNDSWPALSWSAVDYNGLPKALFYYMQRAFAPTLVGFQQCYSNSFDANVEQNGRLFCVGDSVKGQNAVLKWQVLGCDGKLHSEHETEISTVSSAAQIVGEITIPDFKQLRFDSLLNLTLTMADGKTAHNRYTLSRPKFMNLRKPNFNIQQADASSITISSDYFAKGVYIFHPDKDVIFSNNYFDLLPNEAVEISSSKAINSSDIKLISYHH
ncbi:MAG: glycoside hydrolase family 2 protein [Calditrichota bacterium]